MDYTNPKRSVSLNYDSMDPDQADGESTTIESTAQDIIGTNLPELSPQLGPLHSPPIEHEHDVQFSRTRVEVENPPPIFGKSEEESGLEDDKGAVHQVSVDETAKLKINLERGTLDSAEKNFPSRGLKLVSNGISHLRGPGQRSIASASSPYCRVIINPSWETSKLYHEARGEMMDLHLRETCFRVHRTLLLSKIPRLPLLYTDLEPEEDDEHFLNEPLHNINLMVYWIYHECLPPIATMKRLGRLEGTTWDPVELYMFAEKLSAFELMNCIMKSSS